MESRSYRRDLAVVVFQGQRVLYEPVAYYTVLRTRCSPALLDGDVRESRLIKGIPCKLQGFNQVARNYRRDMATKRGGSLTC